MPSARRGFEKPASGPLSSGNGARADLYESLDGERSALGFCRDYREIQMTINKLFCPSMFPDIIQGTARGLPGGKEAVQHFDIFNREIRATARPEWNLVA